MGRDFPGGPVVKTSLSNAGGVGSIPGQGTYCLNVSLADANSLAMVSTQLVMPGR